MGSRNAAERGEVWCSRTSRCLRRLFSCALHSSSRSQPSCVMRWADPEPVAMATRLAIFQATTRFLIALAAAHVDALMMRTVLDTIDRSTGSEPDYGALLATSRLPPDSLIWNSSLRIRATRIGMRMTYGICFINSPKNQLSRKAGNDGTEGASAARRRSRWR